jgi:hypothetical protein
VSHPELPSNLRVEITENDLNELWYDLCAELMDNKFAGRTHGNRRTRDAGCEGPLCRKAVREHGRRRNSTAPSARYESLDLLLDTWFPIATARLAQAREKILQQIAPAS